MSWISERLTAKRLAVVGVLIAIAAIAVAVGDPFAHNEAGEQTDGQVGLSEMPKIVWFTGLAVAFILAMPPRPARDHSDDHNDHDRQG